MDSLSPQQKNLDGTPVNKRSVDMVSGRNLRQTQPSKGDGVTKKRRPWRWVGWGVFVVLLIAAGVLFAVWSHGLASEYVVLGDEARQEGSFAEARDQYDLALALRIFNGEAAALAHVGIGEVYEIKGQPEKAVEEFEAAYSEDDKNPSIILRLATAQFDQGDVLRAKELSDGLQGDDAKVLRGRVLLREGSSAQAREVFATSSAEDAAWYELLVSTLQLEPLALTGESFGSSLRDNFLEGYAELATPGVSDSATGYAALADLYLTLGEPDLAVLAADKALERENDYRDAYALKAEAYLDRRQFDLAKASLGAAQAISPLDPNLAFLEARILVAAGEDVAAIDTMTRAEDLGATSVSFRIFFADLLRQQEEYVRAQEKRDLAFADESDNAVIATSLYWDYLLAGNLEGAKQQAELMIKRFPNQAFGHAAQAYVNYRFHENADVVQKDLDKARDISSAEALTDYVQGLLALDDEEAEEAVKHFVSATDKDFSGEVAGLAEDQLNSI